MGTISKEDAAYLAGIIDGEGCLGLELQTPVNRRSGARVRRPVLTLCVVNTSPALIRRVSEILEALKVPFHYLYARSQKEHWRERLTIRTTANRSVGRILDAIVPYLSAKQDEAQLAIEFIRWREEFAYEQPTWTDERWEIAAQYAQRLSDLKRRRWNLQRLPRPSGRALPHRDEGIVRPAVKAAG